MISCCRGGSLKLNSYQGYEWQACTSWHGWHDKWQIAWHVMCIMIRMTRHECTSCHDINNITWLACMSLHKWYEWHDAVVVVCFTRLYIWIWMTWHACMNWHERYDLNVITRMTYDKICMPCHVILVTSGTDVPSHNPDTYPVKETTTMPSAHVIYVIHGNHAKNANALKCNETQLQRILVSTFGNVATCETRGPWSFL